MKLLLLDRDGVINHDSPAYIKSPEEWLPIPGSLEAIAAFHRQGWKIAVVSNQSGLGRGYFSETTLLAIHAKMQAASTAVGGQIDAIFYCPHHPSEGCHCRKPKPGLLEQAATHFAATPQQCICIGDSWRDIEACLRFGGTPYLVRTGNGQQYESQAQAAGIDVYDHLSAAATAILALF